MSMRPAIFFFVDPGVRAVEEEVEGGVIGDLLGVGDGVGARDQGQEWEGPRECQKWKAEG